jgi:8-oxo-dGTP pyrophosphatase MutT (NUDIX family)
MGDKTVFSVPWFDVLERPVDGSAEPHYIVRPPDYVTVLAATTDGSILLVRQYRPAVRAETLELPSGHIDGDEYPEEAARRELAEETGFEAKSFELLGTLNPDVGRMGNRLWCFYADSATEVQSLVRREAGVELVRCEPRELLQYVGEGKITHALHMAVLLLAETKGRLPIARSNGPIQSSGRTR